jgi:hypothetical protein
MGESEWADGTTENISRSGVLFWVASPMEVDVPVEIGLVLVPVPADRDPQVLCRAKVVRSIDPTPEAPRTSIAARIWDYRFGAEDGTEVEFAPLPGPGPAPIAPRKVGGSEQ